MKKLKKIIAGSAIICILIIIGVSYTFIPRKIINEEFNAYIFSNKNMQIKKVPITLKGKLYKRIMQNDIFIGIIEIEGEIVEIKSSEGNHSDLDNSKYYYTCYCQYFFSTLDNIFSPPVSQKN
ncbi:hypothetical protein ACAG39_08585 [Caldicellulosiruptoraceae bacterium PP1]